MPFHQDAFSAQPHLEGQVAPPLEAPAAPKASRAGWIAAVVGALVLLVGGGAFALTALGSSGGADSPEAAVDELVAAINSEDFITIAELMEPSERRAIAEPMITGVLPELIRLGVLDDSADAGAVEGVDLELVDVTYDVVAVDGHPDLVHVFFTGGDATSAWDVDSLPLGSRYRELLGDDFTDDLEDTQDAIEPNDTPIVFVERDGRWYMSMLFTIGEAARLDANEELPALADAPEAIGADSPEEAVEGLFDEIADLDLEAMIGRMDPEEMAVLYRYSPLFAADGQSALDDLDRELASNGVRWDIDNFDFDSSVDGDSAVVTIRGMEITIESPDVDVTVSYNREQITGEFDAGTLGSGSVEITPTSISVVGQIDGQSVDLLGEIDRDGQMAFISGEVAGEIIDGQVSVDPEGTCSEYSFTGPDVAESGCIEDSGDVSTEDLELFFEQLGDEFPGFSFTTHQVDGAWYVAPISTMMDGTVGWLESLEDDALVDLVDNIESGLVGGFNPDSILALDEALNGGDQTPEVIDPEIQDLLDQVQELEDLELELPSDDLAAPDFELPADDFTSSLPDIEDWFVIDGAGEYSDSLSTNTLDVYELEVLEGQTITMTMIGELGLDTFLATNTPDGRFLENDDNDIGLENPFDSHLVWTANASGNIFIEAGSYEFAGEGPYTLIIEIS